MQNGVSVYAYKIQQQREINMNVKFRNNISDKENFISDQTYK